MRAKLFQAIVFPIFFTSFCIAQTIVIPTGTTPVIDGTVLPGEWDDADSVYINISANVSCKVLFKHDCNSFYFAYLDNLESMNILFPEILFDVNNSKSGSWEADDWWFHVSATDCYYQGAYAVYSNCLLSQPAWSGVPNFASGPPTTDTVEIRIPFTTIGTSMPDTIGICFVVTNTASVWRLWPSAATTSMPSTWADAVVDCNDIGINEKEKDDSFTIYPLPASNKIIVAAGAENKIEAIDIFDLTGRNVKSLTGEKFEKISIDVSDLQPGMLLVKVKTGNKKDSLKKVQIIR